MNVWTKRLLMVFAVVLGLGIVVVLAKLMFVDFVVDYWWFQSQGLTGYFFLRGAYRYLVFIFFGAIFFGIFYVNFRIASQVLEVSSKPEDDDTKGWVYYIHYGLQRMYLLVSFLMALPIAIPMYTHWEDALNFLFGSASGVADPLFGKDISFYLFSLPVYHLVYGEILLVFILLLAGVFFQYGNFYLSQPVEACSLPGKAQWHINVLVGLFFAILCWGVWLERYDLLNETKHLPIFSGPGYVEMRIILPFIWLTVICLAATGISLLLRFNEIISWKPAMIFGGLFILAFLGKNATYFGDVVQKFFVAPNQMVRDRYYIEASIRSTLSAYGLDKVETRAFKLAPTPVFDAKDPLILRRLQNIPVWDRYILKGVFDEIQGIRTYYSFPSIDVGRYRVKENYRQVYLGAREIQLSQMPKAAQNWINTHLQYTHGLGVAMIPAAQAGEEFMTWFIKDIPPQSDFGLTSSLKGIYYSQEKKPFIIVPNDVGEIGFHDSDSKTVTHYEGRGGIAVDSIWRKVLLATFFNDRNIFFTSKTNNQSRILFRRRISDRIRHITPFLKLDEDPYIVSTADGLFWVQDAYTTSGNYPMAARYARDNFNYIRNSVKVVVDAYHGKVSYYIADPGDPIINTYGRMYPGVFRSMTEMPEDLKQHIRYPRDIFTIQMSMYASYHQADPEGFFRQEDIWKFAKVPEKQGFVPASPYYLTLDLFEPGKDDFLIFLPLSPFGRDNLRALMVANSDPDNYGQIIAYSFPRTRQVYGPAQVHSLINQDVVISEQFTLWDQEGSEVILGKMIIEPTGGALLYIQPVYLQEEGPLKIPQLKRLIMALEDAVVMAPSLEEAAVKLEAELVRKYSRHGRRYPTATESPTQKPAADPEPLE